MSSNLKVNTILPSSGNTVAVSGIASVTSSVSIASSCTATTFYGSGANLTSLPAQVSITGNADNRVITGGSGVNLNGESNFTWTGSSLQLTAGTGNQFPFNLRNDFTPNSQRSDLLYAYNGTSNNTLRIGSINSNGGITLQSTRANDSSVKHKLLLNPDGGNIGINDTDPSYKLNVIGDNTAYNGIGMLKGIIGVQNDTTAFGSSPTAGISFQTKYRTGPDVPLDVAAIWGGKENTTNGDKDGYMGFATREEGGSGSQERMRITSDGKVVAGGNGAGYPCRLQSHGAGDLLDLNSTSGAGKIRFYESGAGRFNIETLNGTAGLRFYDSLNGVERMRISGEGIISMPNQPMVRTRGGWSNVDWNGYKQISWNGEDEDIGSNFSSGVFTVPSGGAGRYIVTAQFIGPSNAGQFVLWSFFKNTTALNPWVQIYSGSTNTETGAGTVATTCAVGDTLRIAWHGSYSTPYNGGYNSFSIYKVH